MVPERLDRVRVATSLGTFEIPWDSRDALLDQLVGNSATRGIRDAFVAVGASRPVTFSRLDTALLVAAIDAWMARVGDSWLPDGILALRNELAQDMTDDE